MFWEESHRLNAPYVVLYEVETDDLDAYIEEVLAQMEDGRLTYSDVSVVDIGGVFEMISDQMSQEPASSARTGSTESR